jgi:hypothetical protein
VCCISTESAILPKIPAQICAPQNRASPMQKNVPRSRACGIDRGLW